MTFEVSFRKGWLEAYKRIFKEVGLELSACPANLEVVEQIPLVRNRIQHPEMLGTVHIYLSESDLDKHPTPYFVTDSEIALMNGSGKWSRFFPPVIAPTKEKVLDAISQVENLCSWLEAEYCQARDT
jgi:hypothetical protein